LVLVPANPELGMAARLGLPIRERRGGRCLGRLWMLAAARPLDAPERAALCHAATRLADLLVGPGTGGLRREVDGLVRDVLVDGSAGAFERLREHTPELVDHELQAAAAVPTAAAGTGAVAWSGAAFGALANGLTPALRSRAGYLGAHVVTEHLLVLLHRGTGPPGNAAADRLLDELDAVLALAIGPMLTTTIGHGGPAPSTARAARRSAEQAVAAAEMAALDPALPRRIRWSELGAYRSILGLRSDGDLLAGLADAGASAPMLRLTLETYLDLGGDVQATAARLSLHRSSLYYRLDRIAGFLGVDLGEGLTRLGLHLALKADRAARRRLG
ncbi:MAG TPA: helix-turn-helix domain-containing protein, partial [Pseudonocardia sp.]|nr:helix-turn-helix domain-containing protein [Pseudonocardia sp.]